ncbi:MAG: pyridoxal phosphate-dependent decarboxylase family protein, partial [Acidimicrobiales bacterium]
RCTYTWQSAWSKALGDDRYPNNSFVFDITDGQITGMTNTFAQGPVDGFDNHISEVTTRWLQEIHPDDVAVMFDESGLARNSAESLTLWQTHTEEFVTSLTGVGDVTIETSISVDLVEGERVDGTGSGTFAVTGGAGSLGCSAGTVAEVYSFQVSVEKVMTCTGGPRAGTFTISAGGALPGGAASTWEIVDSTGDFAGLTGSGPYLGRDVELDETTANPIYVFASVSEYTDEIVGTIEFGDSRRRTTFAGGTGDPLNLSSAERRALGRAVLDFVDTWLEDRATEPATYDAPDVGLMEELLSPPSEQGREPGELLDAIDRATRTGFDSAGPGFLSYIPTGALYTAALGSLVGSATNQYTGGSHASPGTTAIEESVIRWMTELFGLPASAGGLLLSGGSIANLTAVVAARSRLGDDFADGVIYASTRAHHSIEKAARIAGIANFRVRLVATDEHRRLDPAALETALADDAAAGLRPLMIVANAGTTDTGAIDQLAACADIAEAHETWFHVDAAYGGFFQLTDRGKERLSGIDRADSITVDAHKSLLLPFGIGGLLVRDPATLVDAHEGAGAYMQDIDAGELPHYMEMGPELTRPNRGVPVWLALNLHGAAAFRSELDRMLDLAETAAARLLATDGIELIGSPELSVVAFRATAGDDATRGLLEALLASGRIHASSTTIDGVMFVRLAFLSQRTTSAIADLAVDIVERATTAAS